MAPRMRIVLTKLTDERHRLTVRRVEGASESVELETRSALVHDLVHYAVEVEGGFERGFFGTVAGGTALAACTGAMMAEAPDSELARVERIVGPLQSVWKAAADRSSFVERARRLAPEIADAEVARRVYDRLRALVGRWRATPCRGEMELGWPAGD